MSDHIDLDGFDDDANNPGIPGIPDVPDTLEWIEDLVDEWDDPIDDDLNADGDDVLHDNDVLDNDVLDNDVVAPEAADPISFEMDVEPIDVVHENGATSSDALQEALVFVGADEAAAAIGALDVAEVDPRLAASALDASGLDGRVEHSEIGALVEAVADGQEVVLAGPAGAVWVVTDVDTVSETVTLEATADGRASATSLRDLADAWALIDNEVLVIAPPAGGLVQLAGDTLIVAVDVIETPGARR